MFFLLVGEVILKCSSFSYIAATRACLNVLNLSGYSYCSHSAVWDWSHKQLSLLPNFPEKDFFPTTKLKLQLFQFWTDFLFQIAQAANYFVRNITVTELNNEKERVSLQLWFFASTEINCVSMIAKLKSSECLFHETCRLCLLWDVSNEGELLINTYLMLVFHIASFITFA